MQGRNEEMSDEDEAIFAQIEAYWDERSADFSAHRHQELSGPNASAWLGVLCEHLPQKKHLRILDIGTGSGFFAILLAGEGHAVTGIDMSAEMLHEARAASLAFGRRAAFQKMNAQELAFSSERFDAIVTRNLTWTLPDVMQAYREWHRVLKKGGVLLNFDSDYGEQTFSKSGSQASVHAGVQEEQLTTCNAIKGSLRISMHRRPAWDALFLESLGFRTKIDSDIAPRVYHDAALANDDLPLFALYAQK